MGLAIFSLVFAVTVALIIGRRSMWAALAGLLLGGIVWLYQFGYLLR